jgi:hypothetical protein
MKITTIQPDEDLSKLARRVFRGASRPVMAEALQKMQEANPHLADVKRPAAGTPVVIPDVAGATQPPAADETDPVRLLLSAARQQLGSVRDSVAPRLARQSAEVKEQLALATSKEVVRLGEKFPDLKSRLPALAQAAKDRLAELDKLNAVQQQALAELERDLDEFLRTGGQVPAEPPQ